MELLLELYSEEIPARMQKGAEQSYSAILQKNLLEKNISYDAIEVHCGPRRLCLYVSGLPKYITIEAQMIKGPSNSAASQAIDGFCQSHGINANALETKLFKEQLFYYYNKPAENIQIAKILLEILPKIISSYSWPKSMLWGDYKISWVRPLKNILCILGGEILPLAYGHLKANDHTYGHSIRNPKAFRVTNFADYQAKLKQALVVLSTEERVNIIKQALLTETKNLNLSYKNDERLLEEAAGLAEFPEVMIGAIDQKFMELPAEIISTSIRNHQKYFSIIDDQGRLAPFFAFVSNAKANPIILQGNEKVLKARLADALYFYNKDLAVTLDSQNAKLDNMLFHPKLGSMGDKVERIEQICQYFVNNYFAPNENDLLKATKICKSDLVSEVVGEFPELQGIMGSIYATKQGYSDVVADAIKNHYKPLGPNDDLPQLASAWLALADKLDSLVGLMLGGERATSKGDAYALRRLALGIIRIILSLENLDLDIRDLIDKVTKIYSMKLPVNDEQKEQILQFIEERAKFYFKDLYSLDIVNKALNLNKNGSLFNIKCKIEVYDSFFNSPEGQSVDALYKRINNILQSNVTNKLEGNIDPAIQTEYERNVSDSLVKLKEYLNSTQFSEFESVDLGFDLFEILKLEKPIAELFEHILIIDPDPVLAKNRLLLLQDIKDTMSRINIFS